MKAPKEQPDLLDESSPENVKGWESTLQENEMGKTMLVAFRLENELLRRIDAYGKRLEEETPGLKLARVDVVRILLIRALSDVESSEAPRKQRG